MVRFVCASAANYIETLGAKEKVPACAAMPSAAQTLRLSRAAPTEHAEQLPKKRGNERKTKPTLTNDDSTRPNEQTN